MKPFKYCPMCTTVLRLKHVDGRKRKICGKCGWINYLNPVPVVSCLVRNSKGNLLLIKRGIEPEKGKWALPGGFQEVNETSEEAGRRELFEETGVKGEVVRLVGVHVQPSKTYGQVLMVGYEYKALNKTLKVGDDAADTKYFPKNKLPKIPFKSQRKLIKQFYN